MPHATHRTRILRASALAVGLVVVAAALVSCRPEPAPSPTRTAASAAPDPTPSAEPTTPAPEASADTEDIALPTSCEAIYSPEMLASLNAQNPPLNDPGVTMESSQNVEALELLTSGIPTIRCSWGVPSEHGLATNVSVITPEQAAELETALLAHGFGAEELPPGTAYRIEQRGIDLDDNEYVIGETHFLHGNAWISTRWINFAPAGYTEDIVATLRR